ncbi:hypothetical protein [Falsibacillus pallidus]|uniref:hypothetical protein n=1 Tax=Falsibacillus pallidus TaxID=493781 RepID=UPI003D95F0A0
MKKAAITIDSICNDLGNPEGYILKFMEKFLSILFKIFLAASIPAAIYIINAFLALH